MSKAEQLAASLQERYEFSVELKAALMHPFKAPPDPRDEELRDAAAELRRLSAKVKRMQKLIDRLDEHEGAEAWSEDLRADLNAHYAALK